MFESLQRKEKYEYRHRMLEYLYDKIKDHPLTHLDSNDSKTDFVEMARDLKIDPKKLKEYHQGFHTFEKDHVMCKVENMEYYIFITEAGIFAYLDEYWLREGEKELNERIFDRVKWRAPIISTGIALLSLMITIVATSNSCNRVDRLERAVDRLQKPITQDSLSH